MFLGLLSLVKHFVHKYGVHKVEMNKHDYLSSGSSEAKTILVPSSIRAEHGLGCSMPFSWRIRDYLEELWVHTLQREGKVDIRHGSGKDRGAVEVSRIKDCIIVVE